MEVLSVVAVQVKSVQDAIRDKKDIFNFMGEMIKCVPTVGIFITMNPGMYCFRENQITFYLEFINRKFPFFFLTKDMPDERNYVCITML